MSEPNPLSRLYRLQEILLAAKKKEDRRQRTPDHLTHIEAAYRELASRREALRERVLKAEARRRALEEEIGDVGEKAKKYQQQLVAVKTNREYGALLNEIDVVKREVRTREDEILQIDEDLQAARAEAGELEASFPEEEREFEEKMAGWREEQAVLAADIARGRQEADEIRGSIDKRLLATFDRIAGARGGVAVARVTMGQGHAATCSACNLRLRPQLLSDLRLSKELMMCEGCKRILYWDGSGG